MKTIQLFTFLLAFLFVGSYHAQCDANFSHASDSTGYATFMAHDSSGVSNYYWDFGDGNSSSAMWPNHQYNSPGTYTVCLTVFDSICSDTVCNVVTISSVAANCDAMFTYTSPSTGTYAFTSTGGYDFYTWDFGNGNTASGGNTVTNFYSTNGSYYVCLTVTDSANGGCTDTYCDSVLVSTFPNPCDASANVTVDSLGLLTGSAIGWGVNYQYYWDFGDGSTSSSDAPSYQYLADGVYSVCLTITDPSQGCSDTQCYSVSVVGTGSTTCDASFYYFQDSTACDSINFDALTTGYTNYYWDFGDGTQVNNTTHVQHDYTADGSYTVELAVYQYDSTGNFVCADTSYQTVIVNCLGSSSSCDASAMLVDSSGYLYGIPNTYSANYDYFWDFGDGNTSTQPYPWHQYAAPGTYNVCLTVIDSTQMCSDNQCYTFTVVAPTACNASYYLFQDSTNAGVYYAWNMSTGNNLSYFWDFGDGNTSTQAFPIHTYATVGVYQLCLTVSEPGGCTSTYCDSLNVVVKANGTVLGVSPAGQFASIENVDIVEEVNLYPNPTNGDVNLAVELSQSSEFTVSVLNYVGQVIETNTAVLNAGQHVLNMNISNHPKGVYIVNILDENTGSSRNIKLIKE